MLFQNNYLRDLLNKSQDICQQYQCVKNDPCP